MRATDGYSFSLWAYGSFFVNTGNEPPLAFYTSYPADGAEVFSLTPLLEVSNSADVDDGPVTYTFQVYSDAALTDMVASSGGVPGTGTGRTSWVVDVPLEDNATSGDCRGPGISISGFKRNCKDPFFIWERKTSKIINRKSEKTEKRI